MFITGDALEVKGNVMISVNSTGYRYAVCTCYNGFFTGFLLFSIKIKNQLSPELKLRLQ